MWDTSTKKARNADRRREQIALQMKKRSALLLFGYANRHLRLHERKIPSAAQLPELKSSRADVVHKIQPLSQSPSNCECVQDAVTNATLSSTFSF